MLFQTVPVCKGQRCSTQKLHFCHILCHFGRALPKRDVFCALAYAEVVVAVRENKGDLKAGSSPVPCIESYFKRLQHDGRRWLIEGGEG